MSLDGIPGFDDREPCVLCGEPGVCGINGQWYCIDHLDAGFSATVVGIAILKGLDPDEVERKATAMLVELGERAQAADDMGLLPDDGSEL